MQCFVLSLREEFSTAKANHRNSDALRHSENHQAINHKNTSPLTSILCAIRVQLHFRRTGEISVLICAICGRFSSPEQVRFREFRALPPFGQWVCDESPCSTKVKHRTGAPTIRSSGIRVRLKKSVSSVLSVGDTHCAAFFSRRRGLSPWSGQVPERH